MSSLRLAVFQICSNDSFQESSNKILEMLKKVHDVDLCLFPENSAYINIAKAESTPKIDLESSFFKSLQELCRTKNFCVHLGSLPLYKKGRLYNSTLVMYPDGKLVQPYDKIHMFQAHVGNLKINEEINYTAGKEPSTIEVKGWKVGLSICFDLRFSELYSCYAKKGCDLIVVPSAFFRKTGKAHWETLLKARAIESQAYVAAAGQVGVHRSVKTGEIRKSYGHSMVVHPWGDVLMDLSEQEDVFEVIELKKSENEKMRRALIMNRKL